MKLEETKEKPPGSFDVRFQVTLTTEVEGDQLYWRTHVTAKTPKHALLMAKEIFKKNRKPIRDAMYRNWDIDDITPLARK